MKVSVLPQRTLPIFIGIALLVSVFLPRLIYLGTSLTIDESLWIDRGEVFVSRLATFQIEKAIPSIQPGVTTAWLAGLVSSFRSLAVSQASIAVTSGLLVLIATYLLTMLWGARWGLYGGFILALDPFLVAHSRVVHTDALLALTILISVLAMIVYGESLLIAPRTGIRYLALSAIFLGLATITKIFALALVPLILVILAYYHVQSHNLRLILPVGLMWIAILVLTTLLVWPTLLLHGATVIAQINDGIGQYEEGTRIGEVTSAWWYYLREIAFRATPITSILLPFGLVGLMYVKRPVRRSTLLLLLTSVFYAVILSLRGEKSDRYILFTMLSIALLSVIGIQYILNWLSREWPLSSRKLFVVTTSLSILLLAFFTLRTMPYPLAYYNPLYPVETFHKLGWGEGLDQAAQWLSTHHPDSPVSTFYPRVVEHFYTGTGHVDSLAHRSETETTYVVLYRSMFERGPDTPETDLLDQYLFSEKVPVHMIIINNLPYVWIYEEPAS